MLSRTAENLFWTARYIERAETNARLLEVGARNSLIPNTGGGYRNEWESVLQAGGTAGGFAEKYGDMVQRNVETWMFFDRDNPSSVASCIEQARENGRIVRTALTSQVWDALNSASQDIREFARTERSKLSVSDLVDWTLRTCALIRGASQSTQLRNDGYDFTNLGHCLERADSTARLLDVKYWVLLPQVAFVGSGLDNYQWRTILRSMSAHRAFNWAYGGEITPRKIVDFLVLNRASPRSLLTSVEGAADHLDRLARAYGRATPAQTAVRGMLGELAEATVDDVFDEGLHEFLTRMILDTSRLSGVIYETYLSGDAR
ncbi:alpha-E domain-containing protein [Mesobaculum littorinae]|uniref:Alpha-E domain-containing protein n=1 Tax=Mesobaculum littorinae TaxID=2486419 RepID=A0A438AM31_9RHOB|nr:alpha-E domain-containing protein [Mesobaculum littorinae]RVV99596.1 alpha-E domain-containing protein [Mesobaculum littorinae]